jgi:hypothetical protein
MEDVPEHSIQIIHSVNLTSIRGIKEWMVCGLNPTRERDSGSKHQNGIN